MKANPRLVKETCIAGAVIDRTIKLVYGSANGRSRKEKHNPTPEAVQRNNDRIAIKKLTRKMNANFGPGDSHIVLTYRDSVPEAAALKELKLFLRRFKRDCKKAGIELKCIWCTELDKRAHHHLLVNTSDGITIEMIRKQWRNGNPKLMPLDNDRNYWRLADYFIKETSHHFRDPAKQMKQRTGSTRNLENPVVVKQPAKASEFKTKDIKPIKGYQIDEDSIQEYINPITGIPTIYYTMVATDALPRCKGKWRSGKGVKKSREESFSRFEELRQTEFSDMFEWGFL